LVDVVIEDGFRSGDINRPEARFIIDEIKRLVEDPHLACIIHVVEGAKSLLCYKHVVKTVFEATKEASA